MTISNLLLAIWLILVGVFYLGWVSVSWKFIGAWALVTGIVFLLEGLGLVAYRVGNR